MHASTYVYGSTQNALIDPSKSLGAAESFEAARFCYLPDQHAAEVPVPGAGGHQEPIEFSAKARFPSRTQLACKLHGILLMIELLHGFVHQIPRSSGSILYLTSCRIHIINSITLYLPGLVRTESGSYERWSSAWLPLAHISVRSSIVELLKSSDD